MTVEKVFPSGAYRVMDVIMGVLVTRQYMGYTKKGVVALFKREMKGGNK